MKIAIIFDDRKSNSFEKVVSIVNVLYKLGVEILMQNIYKQKLNNLKINFMSEIQEIIINSDIVIVLGGDGTIIQNAKLIAKFSKPILGINNGRLGFLSVLDYKDYNGFLNLVRGEYSIADRIILEVKCRTKKYYALNDISVNRSVTSRIVDYNVYKNLKKIASYHADGIIISTPTGSTAYSFSAGGPIVENNVECFIITPICAHSMFSRSIILDSDNSIVLEYIPKINSEVAINIDGNLYYLDNEKGIIHISKSKLCAKFLVFKDDLFFDNINRKLCV